MLGSLRLEPAGFTGGRGDLSGRVSSCHRNVSPSPLTADSPLSPAIRRHCPTFTLRQNRCVTWANGADSEWQTGTSQEESADFQRTRRNATMTSRRLHEKETYALRALWPQKQKNGSQRNNCQSWHKDFFLLSFCLHMH